MGHFFLFVMAIYVAGRLTTVVGPTAASVVGIVGMILALTY